MWPSAGTGAQKQPNADEGSHSMDLGGMWPSAKPKETFNKDSSGGGAGNEELEAKLKAAKEELEKDKNFYEEALEARMN